MSDENTVYYIAAGKSLEAIEAWASKSIEANRRRSAYREETGAKGFWGTRSTVSGILLDPSDQVPDGFKASREGQRVFVPDRRTKIGKQRTIELRKLTEPRLCFSGIFIDGRTMHWPGCEKRGDIWIIIQFEKMPPPQDAILMKRSEYWAMKEAEEKPVE